MTDESCNIRPAVLDQFVPVVPRSGDLLTSLKRLCLQLKRLL